LAFDASKSEKLGKEVEATLRQNVGKNFLAKRNLFRKIRDLAAVREEVRTPAGAGYAFELTERGIKVPFGGREHKEKRGFQRALPYPLSPALPLACSSAVKNMISGEIKKKASFLKAQGSF
jgi:hypothetical protein